MRRKGFAQIECSIARAVDEVGDPWTLLLLRHAFLGARRFADFQSGLQIPPNTLTSRLAALVEQGLLEKHRYEQHPPRYEYLLTQKSTELLPVIISLAVWGSRWKSPVGPPFELISASSGKKVDPVLVDRHTGQPIEPGGVGLRLGPGASRQLREAIANRGKQPLVFGSPQRSGTREECS